MDSWWDRRGENEIDLICEDELENRLDFCEVKRDVRRFDEAVLRRKAEVFFAANPQKRTRQVGYRGLSNTIPTERVATISALPVTFSN